MRVFPLAAHRPRRLHSSLRSPLFFHTRRLPTLRLLAWCLTLLMTFPATLPFAQAAQAQAQEKARFPKPKALPKPTSLANMPYAPLRVTASFAEQKPIAPVPVVASRALAAASVAAAFGVQPRAGISALNPQTRVSSLTYLDEVGHLARPLTSAQVLAWKQELTARQLPAERRALLHLWLGEWQMARNAQPHTAAQHFRIAQHLTGSTDRMHGLAAYDACLALFYQGAYSEAKDAFQAMLQPKSASPGYDLRKCALWLRHASACAGYHDQRAKQGIPEPPRLDPQCGVAALAAGLRALSLPYDRPLLLRSCHVTGQGSSLADLQTAGARLGVSVHILGADDQGLMALPKPMIAHVEHDHFVALIRADKAGVSYLCSDCGMWPGGRVNLTWKQWHLLEADTYGVICLKGGSWDKTLTAALPAPAGSSKKVSASIGAPQLMQVASAGNLAGLGATRVSLLLPGMASLRRHIVRVDTGGTYSYCDRVYSSLHCPDYFVLCTFDGPSCPEGGGPGGGGSGGPHMSPMGSSAGDPVNLATGEEEYAPPADLTVYNPHGPSITWQRYYHDLGDIRSETPSGGYGYGWSTSYDYSVSVNSYADPDNAIIHIITPSGASITASVPNSSLPSATNLHVPVALPPGAPMLLEWDYVPATGGNQFLLTFADRSQWLMQYSYAWEPDGGQPYSLARITDRNGNYIKFNNWYSYASQSTITDSNDQVLLTINYAMNPDLGFNYITSISDVYGRSVYYHASPYGLLQGDEIPYFPGLDQVSQVVPSTTSAATALSQYSRYAYGYTIFHGSYGVYDGAALLHTITVPSPTGSGTSTSTINYNDGFLVSSIVDANGNTRTYDYSSIDASHTTVTVTNPSNVPVYSYTAGYNADMSGTSRTDGAGNATEQNTFSDPNNPLRPSSVTDGNGNVTHYVWDSFSNLHQMTSPRGTVTNYTYGFPTGSVPSVVNSSTKSDAFALGELLSEKEGSKTATGYTYFEPSGLVSAITKSVPGTTGSTSTVGYSFTYDSLGNILTMKTPGNNATLVGGVDQGITTTFNYGSSPAIGQPLTVTDNLSKTMYFGYDSRGNRTSMTDALGNETDTSYNIADQPLTTTFPATGQTGSGQAAQTNNYLYIGGPLANSANSSYASVTTYDENGNAVRAVNDSYGPEGELLSVKGSTEPATYGYDALYRLSALTDGGSNTTHYYYNAQGYLGGMTYPGYTGSAWPSLSGKDSVRFTSYDLNGNVLQRVDGNGVTTTYTHNVDAESLLTGITYTYPTGYTGATTGTVSFAYDAYGRRGSMTDGTGSVAYTYDDADNPLSVTTTYAGLPAASMAYSYYSNNSRQSMTTPAGTFSYAYDGDGRMNSLTNPYSEVSTWQYLDNSWLWKQTLKNASGSTVAATAYTYNPRAQMTDLQTKNSSGTTLSDFSVPSVGGYDGVGNRTQVTASVPGALSLYSGTTNYTYDYGQTANAALNRSQLTKETSTRGGSYTENFAHDGGTSTGPGNPTSFASSSHTYNADNQVSGYTYDGNGNPTVYGGRTLKFDPENRLTLSGTLGTASGVGATYNGNGLRASKTNQAGTTFFLYDGEERVCKLDNTGAVKAVSTLGANGLLSRRTIGGGSAGSVFYTFDLSGNVCQRLDSTGAVQSTDRYDGWGNEDSHDTNTTDPYTYGAQWGYQTDNEDGLVLCTHRFYDPSTGRWLTRDPIGYDGGINLYGYCLNNPANASDILGYGDGSGIGEPGQIPSPPGEGQAPGSGGSRHKKPPTSCPTPPHNCATELNAALGIIAAALAAQLIRIQSQTTILLALCNVFDEDPIATGICVALVEADKNKREKQAFAVAAAATVIAIAAYHKCVAAGGSP